MTAAEFRAKVRGHFPEVSWVVARNQTFQVGLKDSLRDRDVIQIKWVTKTPWTEGNFMVLCGSLAVYCERLRARRGNDHA